MRAQSSWAKPTSRPTQATGRPTTRYLAAQITPGISPEHPVEVLVVEPQRSLQVSLHSNSVATLVAPSEFPRPSAVSTDTSPARQPFPAVATFQVHRFQTPPQS